MPRLSVPGQEKSEENHADGVDTVDTCLLEIETMLLCLYTFNIKLQEDFQKVSSSSFRLELFLIRPKGRRKRAPIIDWSTYPSQKQGFNKSLQNETIMVK